MSLGRPTLGHAGYVPGAVDRAQFVVVDDWVAARDGDDAWQRWLDDHPLVAATLDRRDDVIVDFGKSTHGDRRRYWVRTSALGDA
jgi:hypothetical protein